MSYYNQGPPPPGQPYQQSNSPYPPQGGYQQQQPYGQPGYNQGPPPPQMNQGYYNQGPPPQQQWGPPPPQQPQWGHGPPPPQQPGWQQGPPGPQPGYGGSPYPTQQGYGAPPPQGPPPGQYGAPPPGNFGPPAGPSLGYIPGQQAPMDMTRAADDLRAAMKGFGTNELALIKTLAPLDPLQVNGVKTAFQRKHHRDLMKDVHGETSGYFRECLEAIIRGPLDQDCHVLHESIQGIGTKESAMNDVLIGRSNADLNAIKQQYHKIYHRTLESDVKGDLSLKTERLFDMIISARRAEENTPVIPQQIDADVQEIYRSTEGKTGTDQIAVCQILAHRSNGQLRAIGIAYKQKYHRSLDQVLLSEFSGHMEQALVSMLRKAEDPAKYDADMLEDSMKGMGTKDQALVRRLVAIHWDRQRLQQCKAAYKHFHKRELRSRVEGETSGDYKNLLVQLIGS